MAAGRKGVSVLKRYFGTLPGQTLAGFAVESKDLPDEDFYALVNGIEDGTLNY